MGYFLSLERIDFFQFSYFVLIVLELNCVVVLINVRLTAVGIFCYVGQVVLIFLLSDLYRDGRCRREYKWSKFFYSVFTFKLEIMFIFLLISVFVNFQGVVYIVIRGRDFFFEFYGKLKVVWFDNE